MLGLHYRPSMGRARKPKQRGGFRKNAGRPALYPEKRAKLTFRFTKEALRILRDEARELSDEEGKPVTLNDAAERLVRRGKRRR